MTMVVQMKTFENDSPAEHARKVLQVTFEAWCVAPESAHAIARRAPHGYVPIRVRRAERSFTHKKARFSAFDSDEARVTVGHFP